MSTPQKHILLTVFTLQGGGAERHVLNLARWFAERGHRADIVTFKPIVEHDVPPNVKVHHFPYERFRSIPRVLRPRWVAARFDRWVKRRVGTPDLVLSNLTPVDFILANSTLPNVHFVLHGPLSFELDGPYRGWSKELLISAYRKKPVVAFTEGILNDFIRVTQHAKSSHVIPNSVDSNFVVEMASHFKSGIEDYLLHVGRFDQQKRQDWLLEAYQRSGVKARLVLLGSGNDRAVRAQIKRLKLTKKVLLMGFVANPYPIINGAKGVVMASAYEGMPNLALEAMALKTPLLALDSPPGMSSFIPEQCLVEYPKIDVLAEQIALLEDTPESYLAPLPPGVDPDTVVERYLTLSD